MEAYIKQKLALKGLKGCQDGDVILYAAEDLCQVLRITPPADILLPHMTVTYFIYHLLTRCRLDEYSDPGVVAYMMRPVFTETRPERLGRKPPAPMPVPVPVPVPVTEQQRKAFEWKFGQGAVPLKATLAVHGIPIDFAPDGSEWFEIEAFIALPQYAALREALRYMRALKTDIGTHLVEINTVLNTLANHLKSHVTTLSFY